MRILVLCLLALVSLPAASQEMNCDSPITGTEMRLCAQINRQKADKELGVIYQEFLSFADTKELKDLLRQSERSWIKYRDDTCALDAHMWKGGSGYGTAFAGCLTQMIEDRTKYLRATLEYLKTL